MADTTGIMQTENIGLFLPDYPNIADIQVLNENSKILDAAIKQAGDDLTAHNVATDAHENRFSKYLLLTGGTMSGSLKSQNEVIAQKTNDTGVLRLFGGSTASTGARIALYGNDYADSSLAGNFYILAGDGKMLAGNPDGSLLWNSYDISNPIKNASISGKVITLTFADGTTKTLTTQDTAPFTGRATSIGRASTTKPAVIVKTYRSGNIWYRKYSDGWIEQGGITENINANSYTVTFPTAFTSTNYYANFIVHGYAKDDSYGHMVTEKTTTTFTWNDWLMNGVPVAWYACGV